jgi:Putative  PD-(D/E)XK family member, (DUF4420)
MDLYELYQRSVEALPTPPAPSYAAVAIPGFTRHRLGLDSERHPCLLINQLTDHGSSPPIVLANLRVTHNVSCEIDLPGGGHESGTFTLVTCTSPDQALCQHFLRIASPMVSMLGETPAPASIRSTIAALVDIFRSLSAPATRTTQGLWAELFIISNATSPIVAVKAWHSSPLERWDFAWGNQRVEVKSSGTRRRVHGFAQDQLTQPGTVTLVIASLFAERIGHGPSIRDLYDSIRQKIGGDVATLVQFDTTFFRTLGSQWEDSMDESFDHHIARDSIRFISARDVPRIDGAISSSITAVRFNCDLSSAPTLTHAQLAANGGLIAAVVPD